MIEQIVDWINCKVLSAIPLPRRSQPPKTTLVECVCGHIFSLPTRHARTPVCPQCSTNLIEICDSDNEPDEWINYSNVSIHYLLGGALGIFALFFWGVFVVSFVALFDKRAMEDPNGSSIGRTLVLAFQLALLATSTAAGYLNKAIKGVRTPKS